MSEPILKTRETCFFCNQKWGSCECPAIPENKAFDFDDCLITEPNVDVTGRFFIDPSQYYGDEWKLWVKLNPELHDKLYGRF